MPHLAENPVKIDKLVPKIQALKRFCKNNRKQQKFFLLTGYISKSVFVSSNSFCLITLTHGFFVVVFVHLYFLVSFLHRQITNVENITKYIRQHSRSDLPLADTGVKNHLGMKIIQNDTQSNVFLDNFAHTFWFWHLIASVMCIFSDFCHFMAKFGCKSPFWSDIFLTMQLGVWKTAVIGLLLVIDIFWHLMLK